MSISDRVRRVARDVRNFLPANAALTAVARPLLRFASPSLVERAMVRLPRLGTVSARTPDGQVLKVHSDEPESVTNAIFYRGWTGVEPEVLPLWRALAAQALVVLDVGAHVGHHSLVAGLANPAARVHSFEPLPRVTAMLRRNVDLNGLANVEVRGAAAGREAGRISFYAVPRQIPSSSSLSKEFMTACFDGELEDIGVDVVTLDALFPDLDAPLLIKIDTETTEPDVIAGARQLIRRNQPVIIVEVLIEHETGPALEAELAAADFRYVPYLMTDGGLQRTQAIRGHSRWRNYLLVPQEGVTIAAMRDLLPTA